MDMSNIFQDLLDVYMFWKRKRPAPLALPPTPFPEQSQNDVEKAGGSIQVPTSPVHINSTVSSPSSKSVALSVSTNFTHDTWRSVKKLPPLPGTVPEDASQDYDVDVFSATSPCSPCSPLSNRGRSIRRTLRPTSQQSLLSIVPWRFSKA